MTEPIGRYFTLFGAECMHDGCLKDGLSFGYCEEHYPQQIASRHARLEEEGRTRPTPPCFDSDSAWREYEVFSLDSPGNKHRCADPCRDCTPEYQRKAAEAGKCQHQEVVFIRRVDGDVVGLTSRKFNNWELACAGEMGKVVQMPTMEARRAAVHKHYNRRPQ